MNLVNGSGQDLFLGRYRATKLITMEVNMDDFFNERDWKEYQETQIVNSWDE